jgi:hypothetical protein
MLSLFKHNTISNFIKEGKELGKKSFANGKHQLVDSRLFEE